MMGKTNNKIANVKATFAALCLFKQEAIDQVQKNREVQKKNPVQKVEIGKKEEPKKDDKKADLKKEIKKPADKKVDPVSAKASADEGKK